MGILAEPRYSGLISGTTPPAGQPYGWINSNTGEYIPYGSGHAQVTGAIPQWTPPQPAAMPGVNINAPGRTTVRYPGTEAGRLWYETSKAETAAAGESERRALTNQQRQVDAAQLARQRALESSGYQDFVSKRQNLTPTYSQDYRSRVANLAPTYNQDYRNRVTNLDPTYSQDVMDRLLGQQRDIYEGQAAAQKRGIVESGGGTMPSGYRRQQLAQADVTKEGLYGRAAIDIAEKKAVQDRIDTVQQLGLLADIGQVDRADTEKVIGLVGDIGKMDRTDAIQSVELAYNQAVMDYGRESDLAKALERIYATTIAATPEYDWGELKSIADRMAAQQEYTVETEGGYPMGGGEMMGGDFGSFGGGSSGGGGTTGVWGSTTGVHKPAAGTISGPYPQASPAGKQAIGNVLKKNLANKPKK